MGPNLFVRNENSAYIMPRVTAHAVMSCEHCAACASRQAGHPLYMWHARKYLWTCHSHKPISIYQKNLPHILALKIQNLQKMILIAMHNENETNCNENFRICAEEPIERLYKQ